MTITSEIAAFASAYDLAGIPEKVRARAIALMTDLAGSAIRAAHDVDSSPSILAMVETLGFGGSGSCTVFGLDRRFSPAAAALLNGAFGHSLDFDDTHAASSLHPSAPVVPAALAAAELTNATGADLVAAIVIGFETCCRIGMALPPNTQYARGFHPTATTGIFGAAAAAGRLLGLDAPAMEAAFGVAASQASGSMQYLENGAWNKRYQVGEAAMKGLMAATLAREGFQGAVKAIEGSNGFFRSYGDETHPERATVGLGSVWETMRIGVKPYPACRYTHAAVDGLIALRTRHDWAVDDVTSVTVGLHSNGMALVGAPIEQKRHARSIVDGQFSMPFAAAVALIRGRFGWDDYDLLGTPEAERLAGRVDVRHDLSLEGRAHPFGATLSGTAAGKAFELRIDDPSGEPDSFPEEAALSAKFRSLAQPALGGASDHWLARLGAIGEAGGMASHF